MRHVVGSSNAPGPISESVLLILMSLAAEPRHGYAILKDVEQVSEGRVKMSTGTLYGALHRLLADGLIERLESDDKVRDKQLYRLSSSGMQVLQSEVTRMQNLTKAANLRLTPPLGLKAEAQG